ncbi:MAG: PilZ domain-containing protein [Nitrospirae bacterium]|nr:MAG: PilZ domain-containing protein [Nitrospirota bacterium]
MTQLRYCERVHTHFPVVFSGEAYVGEGTVLNVSVPGCAVHSRKRVQPGSYLEMRMLVPDATPPLRVGLAKVRWCEGRRFGVEFIQMPGEDQVRLGRLVKNVVPRALPPRSASYEKRTTRGDQNKPPPFHSTYGFWRETESRSTSGFPIDYIG